MEERELIVAILQRTIFPKRDVWTNELAKPRAVWGKGSDERKLLISMAQPDAPRTFNKIPDPCLDATMYIGDRDSDWLMRVQNKVSDCRNGQDAKMLSAEECRARVEVTLQGKELADLSLSVIDDFSQCNFARLQREFFHFALSTFNGNPNSMHLAVRD